MITNDYSGGLLYNYKLKFFRFSFRLRKVVVLIGIFFWILMISDLYSFLRLTESENLHPALGLKIGALCLSLLVAFVLVKKEAALSKENWARVVMELMADIPTAMALINKQGEVVLANRHLCKTLAISEDAVIGMHLGKHMEETYCKAFNSWLRRPVNNFTVKLTVFGYDHSVQVTIYSKAYRYYDDVLYFANIGISNELADSIRNYREFIDTYETVIKSTNNIIWNYNFETEESNYNETISTLFGYTLEEVKGNRTWWANNIHPEDRERVITNLEKFVEKNGLIWKDEYRFRCSNGDYRIVQDHGVVKRRDNGKPHRLLGFMTDITEQKSLQEKFYAEQELHKIELAKAISNAQEAERKSIGEELHDNVCQILGGVKLFINHYIDSGQKDEDVLLKSASHINDAIIELRKMAHCLSPFYVEQFGLLVGIKELVSFATSYRKVKVNLDIARFDESILSNSKKILLYRIAQEQLNNIAKHAHANQIDLELRNIGKTCFFSIRDNGIGMAIQEAKMGFGLKNIQNRVELLDGEVRFISSPGNGFSMRIQFEAN